MVTGFSLDDWAKSKKENLLKQLGPDRELLYTEEQADEIIQKLKNSWEIQSFVGTSWHRVAQAFFEDKIAEPKDVVKAELDKDSMCGIDALSKNINGIRTNNNELEECQLTD